MLSLGIDPGTATIGYGLVSELDDGSLQAVAYGVITTTPEYAKSHPKVVKAVVGGYQEAVEWIEKNNAD